MDVEIDPGEEERPGKDGENTRLGAGRPRQHPETTAPAAQREVTLLARFAPYSSEETDRALGAW